jgi:hypothetical protein
MIQERVRAGLARARATARAEGRQLGRQPVAAETERAIRGALAKKSRPGLRKIAAMVGVGTGTVQRVACELAHRYWQGERGIGHFGHFAGLT